MANSVVMSAVCQCSFGAAPAPLPVTSQQTCLICGQLAATTFDKTIPTFGMCSNPMNPQVAAATAAAAGVLTPMPCVPLLVSPWMPGSPTVLIGGKPCLNNNSVLTCGYGGVIKIQMTPAMTVQVP